MGSQTGQTAQQATSDPSWQARQQRCAPGLHLFRRGCRAWRTLRHMPSGTCCERWAASCVGFLLGVLGGQLGPFPAAPEEAAASTGRECAFARVRDTGCEVASRPGKQSTRVCHGKGCALWYFVDCCESDQLAVGC